MILEQLKNNIGDCKNQDKCICVNPSSYEQCKDEFFYIFDPEGNFPSKIVSKEEEFNITIFNPKREEITFVKTDHCLIAEKDSKCDCVLFNKKKIYFIELKTSGKKQRKDKRKEAVNQIVATLDNFKKATINYLQMEAFALICFKSTSTYPIKASANSQKARLFEEYGVKLLESNSIEF